MGDNYMLHDHEFSLKLDARADVPNQLERRQSNEQKHK